MSVLLWSLFISQMCVGCLLILGIGKMSSPKTAQRGYGLIVAGVAVAILSLFLTLKAGHIGAIIFMLILGAAVGRRIGNTVRMTHLPQMIAALNGVGGLASALIVLAELLMHNTDLISLSISLFVGCVAFSGSVVAFGKLEGWHAFRMGHMRAQKYVLFALILFVLILWSTFLYDGGISTAVLFGASVLIFGVSLVWPVGGADMPIMIAALNACSGWAMATIGFPLSNILLIITGALVGASGAVLTYLMTVAVHRSLIRILFQPMQQQKIMADNRAHTARSGTPEEAAFILENSSKVIIVPGYGMAAAQAQHTVHTMADLLSKKYRVDVRFAVHSVAGRMPGHMNVLLAEAGISYDDVYETEEINREFATADAVYVIGANDITNPSAATDPQSPIYGMPVLNVGAAGTVFFVKRSLATGYSGVENSLFYADNTVMLYGDAKDVTGEIVRVLEEN